MTEELTWTEVTEERYMEMLEMLWPAVWLGHGFLVGECWYHDQQGVPCFQPFLNVGDRFFEGSRGMTIAEFRSLRSTLGDLRLPEPVQV